MVCTFIIIHIRTCTWSHRSQMCPILKAIGDFYTNASSAFETCSVSQPLNFHRSECIGPKERIKKNVFSFYWETDNLWGPSHLWNFPLSQALCNRCTLQQAQFSLCLTGFNLKCLHLREKCRWDICSSCAVDKSLCNKVHTCISRYEQGNEK